MNKSTLKLLIVLPLTAALTMACAQDKNKKDRLTRVSGGRAKVEQQKPDAVTPEAKSVATEPAVVLDETTTSQCRVTDSPELADEYRKQSFCDGVVVQTDAAGKFKIYPLINIDNTVYPYEFSLKEAVVTGKTVHLAWTSKKAAAPEKAKNETAKTEVTSESKNDTLQLAYKIPHKREELVEGAIFSVFLNSKKMASNKIAQKNPKDSSGDVIVLITDTTLFDNINFDISITYQLK